MAIDLVEKLKEQKLNLMDVKYKSSFERDIFIELNGKFNLNENNFDGMGFGNYLREIYQENGFKVNSLSEGSSTGNFFASSKDSFYSIVYSELSHVLPICIKITETKLL